jgi:proline racemase
METLRVVDMHTGGEPLRIVTGGYPPVEGATILEKRAHARERLDHLRRILVHEPRGHRDMYAAVLVEPTLADADLAVLFMHNEGYSTMCGHAILALGRYAVDEGLVDRIEPVTRVGIECPCGLVVAEVEVRDGRAGAVSFESVPAFLHGRDVEIDVPGHGVVVCDVAYGGAFYALVTAASLGLDFGSDPVRRFVDAGDALTQALKRGYPLDHPDHADLAFLYGTIVTDGGEGLAEPSRNICVFADRQVDRSPTGSGVTARMAAMHARGMVDVGETRRFASIVDSRFEARVAERLRSGRFEAVRVTVSGRAHYSGRAEFTVEGDDPLGRGFLLE